MQKDSIKRIKGLSQSGFGVRLLDIKLFTLAARYKNLTLASKKIHLSQSAASASIKKLESALGINLCCHKRSEFELTREGLHLLPILEQWLKDFDRIISGAENMPFRIATTHALATIVSTVSVDRPELELGLLRPDFAYESVILDRADIAIVLDNRSWSNLDSFELYSGEFGLYCLKKRSTPCPVLLPEDQVEVLAFQRSWLNMYKKPIEIKTRIPSWSLIASICSGSEEVGFLPDFLAKRAELEPMDWQPRPHPFKVLAIYKRELALKCPGMMDLLSHLKAAFNQMDACSVSFG